MKTIRNYAYGMKAPHVNIERVNDQIWKAHRYRNALVELERNKLTDIAAVRSKFIPGLADAEKAISEASLALKTHYDAVSERNAEARSRTGKKEDREKTNIFRESIRNAAAKIKELKSIEKSAECIAAVAAVQEKANARGKELRANCGVYWGTYLIVEDEAMDSFKASKFLPKFMRYEGHGCVAAQLQGGLAIEKALDCTDTRLKIEATDHPKYFIAYLRIGSEEDKRAAVWTAARVKFHQPVPPGSIIKWAFMERKRVGLTSHWQFRLTIEIPDGAIEPKPMAAGGVVGVNLGWRKVDGGLRVAYWVGSDGADGELVIPEARVNSCGHPNELQSIRDSNFNEMRAQLAAWIKDRMKTGGSGPPQRIPDWLIEATQYLHLWKSAGKLAGLIVRWRDERFPGDEAQFDLIEAWRKQDKHLCNWEGHERSTNWRKEMYRQFALMLARRYKTIITEDSNWASMLRRPNPDESEELYTRYMSRIASPGLLREILVARGAIKTKAKDNTRRCHACGEIAIFDAAKSVRHTCGKCGAEWDQDANAARNSLAAFASGGVMAVEQGPREVEKAKAVKPRITVAEWRKRGREKRASRKMNGKSSEEAA